MICLWYAGSSRRQLAQWGNDDDGNSNNFNGNGNGNENGGGGDGGWNGDYRGYLRHNSDGSYDCSASSTAAAASAASSNG